MYDVHTPRPLTSTQDTRGSSFKNGTTRRRRAWPLHKPRVQRTRQTLNPKLQPGEAKSFQGVEGVGLGAEQFTVQLGWRHLLFHLNPRLRTSSIGARV